MNDIQGIRDAYPEAAVIVSMAQAVWNGAPQSVKIDITVSDRLKAEFLKLFGKDIQTIFITDSDARHIKKQHGQNEATRGQADITPADFALIPFVMNEFDTVEHTETDKKGNKKILFTKKFKGTVYLATIERGLSKGEVRTLWKSAGAGASC
jgi:hypothetical protein